MIKIGRYFINLDKVEYINIKSHDDESMSNSKYTVTILYTGRSRELTIYLEDFNVFIMDDIKRKLEE